MANLVTPAITFVMVTAALGALVLSPGFVKENQSDSTLRNKFENWYPGLANENNDQLPMAA